jgi:hypothetical protein
VSHPSRPDPIEALERFLAGIAPYDPEPGVPMMSLEIRVGRSLASFQLTERATRALTELLLRHIDPDNCGSCPHCGTALDKNLHCPGCRRVDGIFGQTVAHLAAAHAGDEPRELDRA